MKLPVLHNTIQSPCNCTMGVKYSSMCVSSNTLLRQGSKNLKGWSLWPCGLRRWSAAARLLGLRARTPSGVWLSRGGVCCSTKVPATRRSLVNDSYRVWSVTKCNDDPVHLEWVGIDRSWLRKKQTSKVNGMATKPSVSTSLAFLIPFLLWHSCVAITSSCSFPMKIHQWWNFCFSQLADQFANSSQQTLTSTADQRAH